MIIFFNSPPAPCVVDKTSEDQTLSHLLTSLQNTRLEMPHFPQPRCLLHPQMFQTTEILCAHSASSWICHCPLTQACDSPTEASLRTHPQQLLPLDWPQE